MRPIAALLVALAVAAGPAAAATPSDLSADPLDRGALLALPSVYRVVVTIDVPALETSEGRRVPLSRRARTIVESGTAFAVAPDGWLATARHVVAPDGEGLARLAYRSRLAYSGRAHTDATVDEWVQRTGARPVGARVQSIEVAQADTGEGGRTSATWRPTRVVPSGTADLALLRIPVEGAPALELDEAASIGTPVVSIGFGRGSALDGHEEDRGELEPAIRRGELRRTGALEDEASARDAIAIAIAVRGGDSGAPVVNADGAVRGVVIRQTREDAGIAERATELRELMTGTGVRGRAGVAAERFREGMRALWRLDPGRAERAFDDTLTAFPQHTLAVRERSRAEALADGDLRLAGERRPQSLLMALGVLAAAIAFAFGAALAASFRRGGPSPRGR